MIIFAPQPDSTSLDSDWGQETNLGQIILNISLSLSLSIHLRGNNFIKNMKSIAECVLYHYV